jgi:hypothetical protein
MSRPRRESILQIGEAERAALAALRQSAEAAPDDCRKVLGDQAAGDKDAIHAYFDKLDRQTVSLPVAFRASYAVETGHPGVAGGTIRHLCMWIEGTTGETVPGPQHMQPVAEMLGFAGCVAGDCDFWAEVRPGQETIIHLMQPFDYRPGEREAIRRERRARLAAQPGGRHPEIPGRIIH